MPSENFYPPKSAGSGSGDVAGPASSTDNAVVRFDGTTGKIIQGSQVVVDDSGNLTTPGTVDGRDVSSDGAALDSHVANTSNPHATTKGQVGLGNVDNTSDVNKPVSTAQAAADAAVQAFAIQRANHTGTQVAATISDFATAAQTAATAAGTDINTANTLVKRNANKGFAVSYTDLDPTAGDPAYAEGRLFYDNAAKTLAYYNNSSNVKLNIGQESYIRVANVTGSIIPNGTVVYITGSSAGLVTVAPAQANAVGTARAIGVTTEALPATTGVGYVTSYGVVNTLNTSAFAAGARLFLSATTPGAFTDVAPTGTNYSTPVGFVGTVDATVGSIFVDGGVKGQIGRGSANQLRGMNAAATEEENKTLTGTTNEVGVTHGVGTITLGINGTIQTAKGGTSQTTVQGATAQYGGYIRSVKTANYTMVDADWVVANSTAGSFTLTLPTMTTGQRFKVTDGKRTWDTFPVTLAPPAGQSIAGQANGVTLVLNIKGGSVEGVYDGTTLSINSTGSTTFTSSSGSGEKNYISSPNNSTGWTASAAGIAVTTETTRTLLPDNSTQQTGIKILRASATDYVFTRFTLDQADYNKKLKIQFDQAYAGTAADYTVRVFSNTAANYSGTSAELTVSPSTSIPTGTGQVQMSFDSSGSTSPYLEVRIYGNSGTTPIYMNNFLVGPGVIGQQIADYDDLVVTMAANTTNTTVVATETRKGSKATYRVLVTFSGVPGATSLALSLPAGRTINTTALLSSSTATLNILPGSSGVFYDLSTATGYPVQVDFTTTSSVTPLYFDDTATGLVVQDTIKNSTPVVVAAGDTVTLNFTVPINEWANSSLNSGAGAQVEYAYNTDTSATASVTASGFSSGSSGIAFPAAWVVGTQYTRRVRFSAPVQSSDILVVEVKDTTSDDWYPIDMRLGPFMRQGATEYGVRMTGVSGSPADLDIVFNSGGFRADNGTYAGNGTGFSALTTLNWRVRKVNASSPVGFGLATATDSGISSGNRGYAGAVNGVATGAGNIGEIVTANLGGVATVTANTYADAAGTLTLTPGNWEIVANPAMYSLWTTGQQIGHVAIRDAANTVIKRAAYTPLTSAVSTAVCTVQSFSVPITVTTSTTYKLSVIAVGASASGTINIIANNTAPISAGAAATTDSYWYAKRIS